MQFPKFLRVVVFPKSKDMDIIREIDTRIAEVLAESLRFSLEIITPSDGQIGKPLPNGTWTGMFGVMQRREADLLSATFMNYDRAGVVDFCYPFDNLPVTFITTKPKYVTDPLSFLKPFSFDMWMCILVCIVIFPIIFALLLHKKRKIGNLILLTCGIFLSNSPPIQGKRFRDRVLILACTTGAMFLSYSYSSVLLAHLSFPPLTGVKNIPQLSAAVTKGSYRCVSPPGAYVDRILNKSSNPDHQVIAQSIRENDVSVGSIEEELESSKASAYISSLLNLAAFKQRYFVSQDNFYTGWKAVATQKNFCCKMKLDHIMHYIWSSGIFGKISHDVIFKHSLQTNSFSEDNAEIDNGKQLTVAHMKGIFALLVTGLFLSTIVFLVELVVGYFNQDKRGIGK